MSGVYYEWAIEMLKRLKFAIVLPLLNVGLAWILFSIPIRYSAGEPTPDSRRAAFAYTVCMGINSPAHELSAGADNVFRSFGLKPPDTNGLMDIGLWWFIVGLGFDLRRTDVSGILRLLVAGICVPLGLSLVVLALGWVEMLQPIFVRAFSRATGSPFIMGELIEEVLRLAWALFLFWVAFKQVPKSWFPRVTAALRRPVV
jgi:hypothetical protein